MEVKKKCGFCNIEFSTNIKNKVYCNVECRDKMQEKRNSEARSKGNKINEEKECLNCKNKYISTNKIQKYCSKKCGLDFATQKNKPEKNKCKCIICNKEFVISGKSIRKYCSDDCRNYRRNLKNNTDSIREHIRLKVEYILNKAENTVPETPFGFTISQFVMDGFTDKIKNRIRERDGNKCSVCEDEKCELEVHHILKRVLGGTNDDDNLITLCVSCHRAIETNDLNHAVRACYKKAMKVIGKDVGVKLNNIEKLNATRFCLEDIFDMINKEKDLDKDEILLKINNVLVNRVKVGTAINKNIYDSFKKLSEETRIPMSKLLDEALSDLIKKYKPSAN